MGDGLTGVEGLGEEPRWKTKGFLRGKRVDPGVWGDISCGLCSLEEMGAWL